MRCLAFGRAMHALLPSGFKDRLFLRSLLLYATRHVGRSSFQYQTILRDQCSVYDP